MPELVALDLPAGTAFRRGPRRPSGTPATPSPPSTPGCPAGRPQPARRPAPVTGRRLRRAATPPRGGRPAEPGDALVVATSGTDGRPHGRGATHDAVAASARATLGPAWVSTRPAHRWLACLPAGPRRRPVRGHPRAAHRHRGRAAAPLRPRRGRASRPVGAGHPRLAGGHRAAARRARPLRHASSSAGRRRPAPPAQRGHLRHDRDRLGRRLRRPAPRRGRAGPRTGAPARRGGGRGAARGPMLLRCYRDGTTPGGRARRPGRLAAHRRRRPASPAGELRSSAAAWPTRSSPGARRSGPSRSRPSCAPTPASPRPPSWAADPEWGERVVAFVEPTDATPPRSTSCGSSCRGVLGPVAAPKQLRLVAALPRTAIGKVRHDAVRGTWRAAGRDEPPRRGTLPLPGQHRDNPVDWYPWGEEAFAAAAAARPADLPLRRLLGLPLVPRHGARVVRGPGDRRAC